MKISECPNCQSEIKPGAQVCPHCGYAFPFATDMLDAGRVLQNRYELIKLIHSGGMGYIYLAQDKRLDREVVVKQVRQPVKSDAHRKKLEEEALRMAHLKHPAVAMVFDHFVEDDFYFLVVEFIKGQTLNEIFEKSGRKLEESQVTAWMVQVCDFIGYLHDKDMVHRDISPDNIMLTEDGHIKLIDFGTLHDLSMLAGKKAGREGKFGFTPKEQWNGHPVPQSDVFAIGATTYYLLTGFLPVSEECRSGGKPQLSDHSPEFPPIRTRNPQVSLKLQALLQRALQTERSGRYADVGGLRQVLAGQARETTISSAATQSGTRNEEAPEKRVAASNKLRGGFKPWMLAPILMAGVMLFMALSSGPVGTQINITYATCFWGGLLSFFSPVILPLVYAFGANLVGSTAIETVTRKSIWPTLFHSLSFVIGFSIIFTTIGASVGWLSTFLSSHIGLLHNIAGIIIITSGIIMFAFNKISCLNYDKRFHVTIARNPGYIRSFLIGISLALGWTPSIGPVLGALLTYAYMTPDILKIATSLSLYSIGLGVPFILMGLMWGVLTPLWKYVNRYLGIVSLLSGLLLIIIGILMYTDNLSWLIRL